MSISISIENVSKMYRLGQVGTGTLAHDLNRWWARVRGRGDPFARVGQSNDLREAGGEYVWALRDINLEVQQGEILGIIGRNGAGKSTLLKLLSRVTAPTTGRITAYGRMASLLEVGTGFHPELTGRENIFLNGAILGMTRAEIRKHFDDIVDFSGCGKYIDTPVKRYSSGMYVRLAFAVAAHLEPEILIVDEVLAVGDVEFQNRCLGKMRDVSREQGRTILFVSHNMGAVKQLCSKSVLMRNGAIDMRGETPDIVRAYLRSDAHTQRVFVGAECETAENDEIQLLEISVGDADGRIDSHLITGESVQIRIRYRLKRPIYNLRVAILLMTTDGVEVCSSSDIAAAAENSPRPVGEYESICLIPKNLLNRLGYLVSVDFDVPLERDILSGNRVFFEIDELSANQLGRTRAAAPSGVVHPRFEWQVNCRKTPALNVHGTQ